MGLRADFWVSAFLRQCDVEGLVAVLRRRGAPEAGAVYVKHDCLDGRAVLYGPAPRIDASGDGDRVFIRLHKDAWIEPVDAEARLKREVSFDTDIWIVEVESRDAKVPLDVIDM
jgi:hypothetical protein